MLFFFKKYKPEISIFLLALAVRLVFFFLCLNSNGGNVIQTVYGSDGFFEIATNLVQGNGFSQSSSSPFLPYAYGVPVYPFFLAFLLWLTGSYGATAMVQLLLGSLLPLVGMAIVRLITSNERAPLFVGFLLALAPYQILFSFIFYTETLFTFIFGLFIIYFLKFLKEPSSKLSIISGFFLGLATLTKATVQYLIIFAIIFSLWTFRKELNKKLFYNLIYFVLVFFIVLSPWLYRNYRTFGAVNLSSQIPCVVSGVLLPSVLAIENGTTFAEEQNKVNTGDAESNYYYKMWNSHSEKAAEEVLRHPIALAKLSLLNAITFFTHDGMLTFLGAMGISSSVPFPNKPMLVILMNSPREFLSILWSFMQTSLVFVLFGRLFWIIVTLLFGIGIYKTWRSGTLTPQFIFPVIIVLYFMLTTMIIGLAANARFRMPVESVIFAVSFIGLNFIQERSKKIS